MKKISLALVFVLLFAGLAYGGNVMIGKAVQGTFPVYVNGQKLDTDAIVIDGISYLPTREVATSLGATVEFQNGQIDVTSGGQAVAPISPKTDTNTALPVTEGRVLQSNDFELKAGNFGIKDGNLYTELSVFEKYIINGSSVPNLVAFKFSDTNIVSLNISDSYKSDVVAYRQNGKVYIKVAALRLKYKIQDKTILITK